MDEFKVKICRLCLNVIDNAVFETINEVPINIFKSIFPKLNLDEDIKHFMCNTCSAKLQAAFDFKSNCLCNEDKITSYVGCEESTIVDLQEIYLKQESNEQSLNELNNGGICRLCVKFICDDFTSLKDVEVDMVHRFIPELNFEIVKAAVICEPCLQSLIAHSNFIQGCLDIDEKSKNFFIENDADSEQRNRSFDRCIKSENIGIKCKKDERLITNNADIKTEEITIKSERDEQTEEEKSVKLNESQQIDACERKESLPVPLNKDSSDKKLSYECSSCNYKSKRKGCLRRHMLIHKDSSEIEWYPCDMCEYKAKHKVSLKQHMLIHKSPSEIQWHECSICDYKAKHKLSLERHMLAHKDPSEVQWHECEMCGYKTKYKEHLKLHMLVHKSPSEIQWFECNSCNYKAKRKKLLTIHLLSHKSPSEIQWYQCDLCEYKAKQKVVLMRHILLHKHPKVQWRKCSSCEYKTKHEQHLKWHVLKHKTDAEQPWLECDLCCFKAKHKKSWERHKLTHQDSSEVRWFKCDSCDHKTKWKHSLKLHMLVHRDPSEIQWFECDLCECKVKSKRSLERHKLTHKSASESTVV